MDTGQRVSDYRRTPFISLWGAQLHWSPGNMHKPGEVVACCSQSWGCGRKRDQPPTLEPLCASGSLFIGKMVSYWGIFVLDYAWQINCRFLSFLLLSLFLAIKKTFFMCVCCFNNAFLMTHACNPSTQMAETGELTQAWVNLKHIASFSQARTTSETCLKNKKNSFPFLCLDFHVRD